MLLLWALIIYNLFFSKRACWRKQICFVIVLQGFLLWVEGGGVKYICRTALYLWSRMHLTRVFAKTWMDKGEPKFRSEKSIKCSAKLGFLKPCIVQRMYICISSSWANLCGPGLDCSAMYVWLQDACIWIYIKWT